MPTAPLADLELRIGADVVGVARLERLLGDDPDRQQALFTPGELRYCAGKRRRHEHLAARFAAKEAVLKAFGTGMSRRMRWTEIEVVNESSGRPQIRLAGAVASFANSHRLRQLDVSLTHTEGLAFAHAITLWEPGRGGGREPAGPQSSAIASHEVAGKPPTPPGRPDGWAGPCASI